MNGDSMSNFDLDDYLQRQSATIDRALESYLGRYPVAQQTIFRAIQYGVFPGGKRIRPILTLAAGELFSAPANHLMPFACAVELIHAYSLIHDDLPALDDDDLRRGEPAAHKVFGQGMALLAGDGLLTEAFHLMSDREATRGVRPELVLELIHELARAAGVMGLVGGQALDLEAEEKEADLATVDVIHVRKTGALILAAIRIGARLASAPRSGSREDHALRRVFRIGFPDRRRYFRRARRNGRSAARGDGAQRAKKGDLSSRCRHRPGRRTSQRVVATMFSGTWIHSARARRPWRRLPGTWPRARFES